MSNAIGSLANRIINELKSTGSASGVREFYRQSKANLALTLSNPSEELKNIGMIYYVILQHHESAYEVDELQLMSAIGYYVLSLGVKANSDIIGFPTNPLEFIEFLKLRILLLGSSIDYIRYSIKSRPDNILDPYWSPLDDDPYRNEREQVVQMLVSDAAEMKRQYESPLVAPMAYSFQKNAIEIAQRTLEQNHRLVNRSGLDNILYSGKDIHKSLFSFLEDKFRDKESITTTSFGIE